ncbi:unnamed protein product [Spirodela intermedia]|uniref:Epidermal patterning factor-like protein n=1 Tax=Spirodela intermedia TaxID=51605 RepID=A0A7I8KKB0_SPIIN|nr:unnamed protein product [Spirodela intermedia]
MDLVSGGRKGRWRRGRSLLRLSFCFFSLCALLTGGAAVGPGESPLPYPKYTSFPEPSSSSDSLSFLEKGNLVSLSRYSLSNAERRNSPNPGTSLPQPPVAVVLSGVPLHPRPPPETAGETAKPSWWRRRRRGRRKRPAGTTTTTSVAAAAATWSYSVGPGSYPPRCVSKCGVCTPCKPVHVAVPPGRPVIAEYYPEAWRCKCGGKLYIP